MQPGLLKATRKTDLLFDMKWRCGRWRCGTTGEGFGDGRRIPPPEAAGYSVAAKNLSVAGCVTYCN